MPNLCKIPTIHYMAPSCKHTCSKAHPSIGMVKIMSGTKQNMLGISSNCIYMYCPPCELRFIWSDPPYLWLELECQQTPTKEAHSNFKIYISNHLCDEEPAASKLQTTISASLASVGIPTSNLMVDLYWSGTAAPPCTHISTTAGACP